MLLLGIFLQGIALLVLEVDLARLGLRILLPYWKSSFRAGLILPLNLVRNSFWIMGSTGKYL